MEKNGLQQVLAELRAKGWRVPEIAEAMDTHRATVYRWEQGLRPYQEKAVVEKLKRLLSRKGPPRRRRVVPQEPVTPDPTLGTEAQNDQ
jgi:transcriptional regulator with XRE-family HTH domain